MATSPLSAASSSSASASSCGSAGHPGRAHEATARALFDFDAPRPRRATAARATTGPGVLSSQPGHHAGISSRTVAYLAWDFRCRPPRGALESSTRWRPGSTLRRAAATEAAEKLAAERRNGSGSRAEALEARAEADRAA